VDRRHAAALISRPLVRHHDRQLGAEIDQLCRDVFGPELAIQGTPAERTPQRRSSMFAIPEPSEWRSAA
jgi:hypothetical protein